MIYKASTIVKYLMILIVLSCNSTSKEIEETTEKIIEPTVNTLELESFSVKDFPTDTHGCSCYFKAIDEPKIDHYLYVDNRDNRAYIRMNGYFEEMELKDYSYTDSSFSKRGIAEHFNLKLEMTLTGQIDETWQYKGSLSINKIDGTSAIIDIVGECGC